MILLETPRLRLRQFTVEDTDRLVELDSDPAVMRYITYGAPTTRETYTDDILPYWFEIYRRTPLLGYRLRRASWGRGYATEGASALIEHGFVRVGTEKISARTLVGNAGSRSVMEKCGLRFETGFTYAPDVLAGRSPEECAAVKYSITRSQWLAGRA